MATEVIHAFEFQDLLGEGVHGQVWRAKDLLSSMTYAVKVGHDLVDAEREYNLYCALEGNNCHSFLPINQSVPIPLNDGSTALGLVMPLAEGTLYDYLNTFHEGYSNASFADLPNIALLLANRLEALQLVGFVHGDLKPENILLWNGELYLCDLGLVTKINQRVAADSRYTPIFRPPEVIKQGFVHRNSDVWAFGCVLFELLTGDCLFDAPAGASEQVLLKHIHQALSSMEERFEQYPILSELGWIADLIKECVQVSADDRPNFSCIISTIESNIPTRMSM